MSGIVSKMGILREVTEKATPDGKKATDAPRMRSRETVQPKIAKGAFADNAFV